MIQQSPPSIRRLLDPIRPVKRSPFSDVVSGPTSPLERNPQSPKGWKNRESDGVGLGIVAAMERSDGRQGPHKITVGTPIKHVSTPIAIGSPRCELGCSWRCCGDFNGPRDDGPFDGFRPAEFLSYCYLCRKRLHGKDIYMYRGEKAFCSMECRYQQIASDEFQENCGLEAWRSSEVPRSSYAEDRLFFMGITAS